MSAFSDLDGEKRPANMRQHRAAKKAAAEERNARTPPERTKKGRRLAALAARITTT